MNTKAHGSNESAVEPLTQKIEQLLDALDSKRSTASAGPASATADANLERILARTRQLMEIAANSRESLRHSGEKLLAACLAAAAAVVHALPQKRDELVERMERTVAGLSQSARQVILPADRRRGEAEFHIHWEQVDSPATITGALVRRSTVGTLCALRESAKDAAHLQGEIDDPAACDAIAGVLLQEMYRGNIVLPGFEVLGRNEQRMRLLWRAAVASAEGPGAVATATIPEDSNFVLFNQRPVIAAILDVMLKDLSVGVREFPRVVHRICAHFQVDQKAVLEQFSMVGASRVRDLMSHGNQEQALVERTALDELIRELLGDDKGVQGCNTPQKGVPTPDVLP